MNDSNAIQPEFDYRTGRPTFICHGTPGRSHWEACAKLNRLRTSRIKEALRDYPPGEQISRDGWLASLKRRAGYLEVPLISLDGLGFVEDDAECMSSRLLGNIGIGREASAWVDRESNSVYKLFDVKMDAEERYSIGLKLEMTGNTEQPDVSQLPADLDHILEKLCVLHEAGACPTEIAGLSEDGKYLIAKQPRCKAFEDLDADRKEATRQMKAVSPKGSYGGNEIWVFYAGNRYWLLSDLHKGNIRRLSDGMPTVIDALIGELPDLYLRFHSKLGDAARQAREWVQNGIEPHDDPFHNVCDDDL
ncbi:hypothetical protein [Prosthecobacter sp.]|uniref:hypothetical protein n=1 Tax=Prosthecobacter sp. TaxID=1965333 RepID=UPI003783C440